MQTLTRQAFDNFCKSNVSYGDDEVAMLEEALNNWSTYTPCKQVADYIEANKWEPLQVVRDRKICDYLYTKLGLPQKTAINLWADWEDYEYELRCEGEA